MHLPLGLAFALILPLLACDLPRDARGSSERMHRSALRVGVADHAPWTSVTAERVGGVEPALVAAFAADRGVRTTWRGGAESELLEALHDGELDVVAAGLTDDTPWVGRVALSHPYLVDPAGRGHVLALAPGENALLVALERYLHEHPVPHR